MNDCGILILSSIFQIFVINLKRRENRFLHMKNTMRELALKWTHFHAVDWRYALECFFSPEFLCLSSYETVSFLKMKSVQLRYEILDFRLANNWSLGWMTQSDQKLLFLLELVNPLLKSVVHSNNFRKLDKERIEDLGVKILSDYQDPIFNRFVRSHLNLRASDFWNTVDDFWEGIGFSLISGKQ